MTNRVLAIAVEFTSVMTARAPDTGSITVLPAVKAALFPEMVKADINTTESVLAKPKPVPPVGTFTWKIELLASVKVSESEGEKAVTAPVLPELI